MQFKNASRMVAVVAVAVGLGGGPLAGTGSAAEAAATGSVEGLVWFDRDADRCVDAGEPPFYGGLVTLTDSAGNRVGDRVTLSDGRYRFDGLRPGEYRVSGGQAGYGNSTPGERRVVMRANRAATVDFGVRGGSLSGQAWYDADEDGVRQAGEAPVSTAIGVLNLSGVYAVTGEDGRYTIHDIPAGTHQLQANDLSLSGNHLGYTRPHQGGDPTRDSDFDNHDGRGPVVTFAIASDGAVRQVGGPRRADVGYLTGRTDNAITLTADRDPTALRVGDVVTFAGTVSAQGNVPDDHGITFTVPAGMRITAWTGAPWRVDFQTDASLTLRNFPPREDPDQSVAVSFTVEVTAPISAAEVVATPQYSLYPDPNPANDAVSVPVHAG